MTFADANSKTVAFLKPAERLVIAERTMLVSTAEESMETETVFLAGPGDAARYCKISQKSADPEAELVRLRFLGGLRDEEAKRKLLDALRFN